MIDALMIIFFSDLSSECTTHGEWNEFNWKYWLFEHFQNQFFFKVELLLDPVPRVTVFVAWVGFFNFLISMLVLPLS